MIRRALLLLPFLLAGPARAEGSAADFVGIYDDLQTEIGAALQLDYEGRFQYYMSYGAVDEMAAGTWMVSRDCVVLDSDPMSVSSFALVDSKGGKSSSFDLTLDAPGQIPIQFFSAVVFFSDGTGTREEFEEPHLHLKLKRGQSVTGVALLFDIYQVSSDRMEVPAKTGSMHFRFDPNDLGTVNFDHQQLRQDGDALLLERYDRTLRFSKEDEQEAGAGDAPDALDPMSQVSGVWAYNGQDCDTDNYFEPPADMPGAAFTLSPEHTYRLTLLGKETQGTFTLEPYEYDGWDYFLVVLEQAQLTFIVNSDRLESWSEDPDAPPQCTQLFERPGQTEDTAITSALLPASPEADATMEAQPLAQRQAFYEVPSVSITVVRDGQIAWSKGFGADTAPDTLYQAASLAKPVSAAGLLTLAAQRGIDSEAEIGDALTSLDLAKIKPLGTVISLDGLLAHKLGASPAGFPGYDGSVPVPGLAELLAGSPRANSPPLAFDPAKIGSFNYGGAGYELAELWSEDITGQPFEVWMKHEVFDPLGLNDSTYAQPLTPDLAAGHSVARGYWSADEQVEGGWRTYPEHAAAGLWTTGPDYAHFLIALMTAAVGEPSPLSSNVAQAMVRPTSPHYGLGVGMQSIDGERVWSANGGNAGYKSFYAAFPERRDAIVILTNGEGGYPLTQEILRSAARYYGWPELPKGP